MTDPQQELPDEELNAAQGASASAPSGESFVIAAEDEGKT
jgi:hypothetical protein